MNTPWQYLLRGLSATNQLSFLKSIVGNFRNILNTLSWPPCLYIYLVRSGQMGSLKSGKKRGLFSGKQYSKCSPSADDEIEKERERGSVYERMWVGERERYIKKERGRD